MTDTRVYYLKDQQIRTNAKRAVDESPEGYQVRISPPPMRRPQQERFHAMIADIADQADLAGERRDTETAKRLLVDAFCRVMADNGEPIQGHGQILPSLEGDGRVQLGAQTRKFTKEQASQFIDYLSAYGDAEGVQWSDTSKEK